MFTQKVWRVMLAVICFICSAFFLLGFIGAYSDSVLEGDPISQAGVFILMVVLPFLAGLSLIIERKGKECMHMNENENVSDPYKTPEASLNVAEEDGPIMVFERFTAWGVFGLTFITLGIYSYYWMYTRANTLNTVHEDKLSGLLLGSFVFGLVLYHATMFLGESETELIIAGVVSIAYIVLYFVVLFKIRNRLKDVINRSVPEPENVSIILTFFFFCIYLQYKINECIDKREAN